VSVGQEALVLLLLENYQEPWEQPVTYMKWGGNAIPSTLTALIASTPLHLIKYHMIMSLPECSVDCALRFQLWSAQLSFINFLFIKTLY
jgi:hypothetical protein